MSTQTTGSLTATGSVTLGKEIYELTVAAQLYGTYGTVTFVFEGTLDGTNWFPLVACDMSNGLLVTGTISPSDDAERLWVVRAEHCSQVRLRVTAIASGTAGVLLQSGSFTGPFITVNQTGFSTTALSATSITATGDVALTGHMTVTNAKNFVFDTTTGTKIGTGTTQKIGFWNATPIVQPANTVDYVTMLTNLGLRATGGTAGATFPGAITCTSLLSSGPTGGGIGYATGAGGAVSQATDRTTGVTLNTLTGAITTQATSLAAGAEVTFTVTNSTVAVGDTVIVSVRSGPTATTNTFATVTTVAAGSFNITLNNPHASTADTGAAILNFAVIKAVSA